MNVNRQASSKDTSIMPPERKPNKRQRVENPHESVTRFLSLEAAEETTEDDDDEDEEEDTDDFFFDNQPIPTDRTVSHHLLLREHMRVQGENDWDGLLSRARQRAENIGTHNYQDVEHGQAAMGPPRLWRVAVKPGCEEAVVFLLMEKIIRTVTSFGHVKSIVGRVSRPGWVFIEARSETDVKMRLCVCKSLFRFFLNLVLGFG
ncbi:hypothetical protein FPV67DRAFT_1682459 [Lyophyllum atratum]|nr:hypothetical protein FPV67DRAFT_1682459 [Lyophyllum atratum]